MNRKRIGDWVESGRVQYTVLTLIALNAVTLGLETSATVMAQYGELLHWIDRTILSVFVAEISLKLFAFGRRFFREPWNVFDFLVVGVALVPASGPLAVLRTLRVLRILRLVSMVPRLRLVVESLLHAVPGIASIAALMLILFYVAAVMATGFFAADYPQWFGNIARSMYSLFQIMTLESWSMGIVRPVMEQYPYAWLFFVPFILLATFTMLNLFIAIIVNTMQEMHARENRQEQEEITTTVHDDTRVVLEEIARVRKELQGMREQLARKSS